MAENLALRIENVSKAFGPVKALSGVNFELRKGEIHALAGENGAGKSTLMNIINGILRPDAGSIYVDERPVSIASPAAAQRLGIGLVHQEIALCPDVSVAENIYMAATNTNGRFLLNYRELRQKAQAVMNRLHPIPVDTLVGALPISHQQLVEIAKALTLDCNILILDEPTAALTETEAQALFGIMRELRAQGMSIIYISHRMAEVFSLCDRITVFRDGHYVRTDVVADTTEDQVVSSLVGREMANLFPPKLPTGGMLGEPLISVRNLSDGKRFSDIQFDLRRGEILGFAGLIGAGRSEIAKAVCGIDPKVSGAVAIKGQPVDITRYADSIEAGMVYLSEDRKFSGVFLDLSIAANISALRLEQVSHPLGLIARTKENELAERLGARVSLKKGRISDPVSSLSGGNQQKVALAKMLSVDPSIMILDEPTRGVDVGAKAEIYAILRNLAASGVGVLVISSELPELIGLCDRVIVIHEGRIAGEVTGDHMTEETIIHMASGLRSRSPSTQSEQLTREMVP